MADRTIDHKVIEAWSQPGQKLLVVVSPGSDLLELARVLIAALQGLGRALLNLAPSILVAIEYLLDRCL